MAEWVFAAELSELTRRKKKQITVAGQPVALFLVGGTVFALHDLCVHKQRSLVKGTVWRGRVICPGHQWAFDPATGWAEDQQQCQPGYDVRVDGDEVFVNPTMRVRVTTSPV
jgi:nitrite reductase/ring-hydroxylating ferredoxin subunit